MKKLFSIFLIGFLILPLFVSAAGLVPCGSTGLDNCTLCHLLQLVNNILNWVLLTIIPIIAPIFIVLGGIYFLIARGDPGMFSKGKSILTAAVIGLIIVYTAWVVLMTILNFLGVAPWTDLKTWWDIDCPA